VRNNAAIEKFVWRTDKEPGGELDRKFWFAIGSPTADTNENGEPQWLAVREGGFPDQADIGAAQAKQ
jgi:hypothetical protein